MCSYLFSKPTDLAENFPHFEGDFMRIARTRPSESIFVSNLDIDVPTIFDITKVITPLLVPVSVNEKSPHTKSRDVPASNKNQNELTAHMHLPTDFLQNGTMVSGGVAAESESLSNAFG